MKVLSTFLFLIVVFISQSFAQVTPIWQRTVETSNLPTWFSATGNTERGGALDWARNKVYVVSRNNGLFVYHMNALTGADEGSLSVTGIAGGTFALNDIEVSNDFDNPKIYASNLVSHATPNADPFKIYRWDSPTSEPVLAFEGFQNAIKRMGDDFTVYGKASDNSMKVFIPDANNHKIFILSTNNNGNTLFLSDSITLPAGTFGGAASCFPVPNDIGGLNGIITNSSGKNLQYWTPQGVLIGTAPGGVISTGTTNTLAARFLGNEYLLTYQFTPGLNNARIVGLTDSPNNMRTYAITPSPGPNTNTNGTGTIDLILSTDNHMYVLVVSTNNGVAMHKVDFNPYINGRFNEDYTTIGVKQNNNLGFGPNMYANKIRYGYDNDNLYLAIEGRLNKTSSDGIALFIDISDVNGAPAGTPLGGVPGAGHLFGNTGNNNFKMDFEVDYGFVINTGGSDSVYYIDAVRYNAAAAGQYIGSGKIDGSAFMGPASPGVFSANSLTIACDSAFGTNRGWEMKIPLSELGTTLGAQIKVFAVVSSSTAFFSNVTVPGNVSGDNLGFNPDFALVPGGPFNTGYVTVPVELVSFKASVFGNQVSLNWSTASELNNYGFYIERGNNSGEFEQIGFVSGRGNSTELNSYTFNDNNLSAGTYSYRLKQVDFDGSFEYSQVINVDVNSLPGVFELSQNYPNPFNPSTGIKFTVSQNGLAELRVYDALGQEVANLFSGIAESGKVYEVNFDAKNLNSGVYFYTLRQNENVSTKKMILVK